VRGRSDVLELAILGLLAETPMHGYELRKRLNLLLGSFRALSYGSLYPCLKGLAERRLIVGADGSQTPPPHALSGKRARIVYELTADGKEHLAEMLATSGPSAWEDDHFGVRFALFSQTDAETRLRILEGRRIRTRERIDEYTLELQRHGLEQVEREVRWLDGLIDNERGTRRATTEGPGRSTGPDTADDARAPQH